MKKTLCAIAAILAAVLPLAAEKREIDPFKIFTPRTTGMGNAFISMNEGFETLWTNPASFNAKRREITILGLDASALGKYDDIMNLANMDTTDTKSTLESLKPAIVGSGIGANAGFGISWVGNRLGLGLYDSLDLYLQGEPFPFGVTGYVDNTIAFIGGYAYPIHLTDDITLTAGAAIRPSVKYRLEVDGAMVNDALATNFDPVTYFQNKVKTPAFGLPVDLGVRATLPLDFAAACTVRDLFATYSGGSAAYDYYAHWSLNMGGSWNPDMDSLKWLIDPTVSLEISRINRIVAGDTSFWKELHAGTELAMLRDVITLYAGLDGGYPALGASLDLYILDLSVAYGTRECGRYIGDRPVSNLTVELSFRID